MNKDTVVASIIGFGLGLVAAIAIWVAPHIIPKRTNTVNTPIASQETSDNNQVETLTLDVPMPHDGDIAKTKEIEVKGKTQNATLVTVSSNDDTFVTTASQNGEFTVKINLSEGANEINVTSLTPNKQEHQQLFVYYVSEN